jgi:hypothetical protein
MDNSTVSTGQFTFVEDKCECDERCDKCGKYKKNPYPVPFYPYPSPWYPPYPIQPWITWTTT